MEKRRGVIYLRPQENVCRRADSLIRDGNDIHAVSILYEERVCTSLIWGNDLLFHPYTDGKGGDRFFCLRVANHDLSAVKPVRGDPAYRTKGCKNQGIIYRRQNLSDDDSRGNRRSFAKINRKQPGSDRRPFAANDLVPVSDATRGVRTRQTKRASSWMPFLNAVRQATPCNPTRRKPTASRSVFPAL